MKDEKKATKKPTSKATGKPKAGAKKPASKATGKPKAGAKKPASKATGKPKAGAKKPASKATDKPKKETFPHFRKYKKSGHPALITAEHSQTEYDYRGTTHSKKDGRHLNEEVYPNPDPNDAKPMYIRKRVRHDEKRLFGKKLPWKYKK